jgi:pimeloyl-ACP methyl ester carboxylesterase
MQQSRNFVKGTALWKIGRIGLAIAAILAAFIGFLMLPADDLSRFDSQPNPAVSYEEAVQRVKNMRAAEVGFNPDCHTVLLAHGVKTEKALVFAPGYFTCPAAPYKELGKLFYDRGYNVLIAPLPYNGLADRMTIEYTKLRAEDLVRYTDQVVDIGRGLGERLTMAGISAGGLVTGWAAQQRQDVDRAVLISPGFGFDVIPESLTPLASRAFVKLPNMFMWDDPELKADAPPDYGYPRMSTHPLGQILRLGQATQTLARLNAPAAHSIMVVTNLNDHGVDNAVTGKVVAWWRAQGADVQTYQFPADLHLEHGLFDVAYPDQDSIAMVYAKLLELIDQ